MSKLINKAALVVAKGEFEIKPTLLATTSTDKVQWLGNAITGVADTELVPYTSKTGAEGYESLLQVCYIEAKEGFFNLYLRFNLAGFSDLAGLGNVFGADEEANHRRWAYGVLKALHYSKASDEIVADFATAKTQIRGNLSIRGTYLLDTEEFSVVTKMLAEASDRKLRKDGFSWDIKGQSGFKFPEFQIARRGLMGFWVSPMIPNKKGHSFYKLNGLTLINTQLGDYRSSGTLVSLENEMFSSTLEYLSFANSLL